jgi:hypothetical protein
MNVAQLPLVALDKSFAHAVSEANLAAFSNKCELLVPSAFYFEILDTEAAKRLQTLTGLDSFRRVDIGSLLRRETITGEPIAEALSPRHVFNPKVLSPDWALTTDEALVQNEYKIHVVNPALKFWNEVIDERQIIGFGTDELTAIKGSPSEFTALCQLLRDHSRIRNIATIMSWPHAALLDETWFHFRHYQALVLQGLILLRRHQNPKDIRSPKRLEHDIHDVEYLTLGLMTGHLATNEISNDFNKFALKWRFHLLRPEGVLITPLSLPSFL